MDFDFLPSNEQKENTSTGVGGSFSVGRNVFIDKYLNHLDAHKVFSSPPIRSEFDLVSNFNVATDLFRLDGLRQKISSNFYGENTVLEQLINGYTQFQDPLLLNNVLEELNGEITADMFSEIEKPKMKINDRFGMFSFDLASMAMTYVYEYFDKKGNIVNANFIEKRNGKFYFENTEVEQKIKRRENGTPVVVSSVRNCLIDFEKQDKKERSVEIIVIIAIHAAEQPKDIIYNAMAAVAVAQNLILKGFKVKLTGLLTVRNPTVSNRTGYYHFIPVKRFNQPLDINAASYVLGDPRFDRYQGFKITINGMDENNETCPSSLGTPIKDINEIARTIETEYVPNSGLLQADTRLYFGGSRNMESVKQEVRNALTILNERYGEN